MAPGVDDEDRLSVLEQDGGGVAEILALLPVHDDLPMPLVGQVDQRDGVATPNRRRLSPGNPGGQECEADEGNGEGKGEDRMAHETPQGKDERGSIRGGRSPGRP